MTTSPTRTPEAHEMDSHAALPKADLGRLLTSTEVAQTIRVPSATLRYWRHVGIGPRSFKMGPRRVLYREEDVLAWAAEQYGVAG